MKAGSTSSGWGVSVAQCSVIHMGRKTEEAESRSRVVPIRLTPTEYEAMREQRIRLGMNTSEYFRKLLEESR